MEPTKRFNELFVWQKAHQFVLGVYSVSSSFPKEEIDGLTSQFRRAAVSIAANIAEGYAKKGKADKLRFFNIAQGSLEECQDYLLLTKDLNFIYDLKLDDLLEEVSRLLNSYSRSINSSR
jgi:four helix bundle protein